MSEDHLKWIDSVHNKHESLTSYVASILQSTLVSRKIDFLSVTGRTKSKEKILRKIERKGYRTPAKQLTDISGIRVIAYFESAIDAVANAVDELFCIDRKNSLDKSEVLGDDRIGYRSVHFVCDLGDARTSLLENKDFKGLVFEIQVRTVLQHAWAELSHDRRKRRRVTLTSRSVGYR